LVYYYLVLISPKTKKLLCIWFPAAPSVVNSARVPRRGGVRGATQIEMNRQVLGLKHITPAHLRADELPRV